MCRLLVPCLPGDGQEEEDPAEGVCLCEFVLIFVVKRNVFCCFDIPFDSLVQWCPIMVPEG